MQVCPQVCYMLEFTSSIKVPKRPPTGQMAQTLLQTVKRGTQEPSDSLFDLSLYDFKLLYGLQLGWFLYVRLTA